MELKDYTTEELKAELKRRVELAKAQKAKEMKIALRCRNCKYCQEHKVSNWTIGYKCMARMWGKNIHVTIQLAHPIRLVNYLKERRTDYDIF